MTSPKRIERNRRNAAKSTGPRTQAGKAAAARNALRHGLLARDLLVRGESEEDFTAYARGVRARLVPLGELEAFVVNRVISASWRLRRAAAAEAALFNAESTEASADQDRLGRMLLLSRYEVTLERSLYKALDELHNLKDRRAFFASWYAEEEEENSEPAASAPDDTDELASFRKNDPTDTGELASFGKNDPTETGELGSFGKNDPAEIGELASFRKNDPAETGELASFRKNDPAQTGELASFRKNDPAETGELASFRKNDPTGHAHVDAHEPCT